MNLILQMPVASVSTGWKMNYAISSRIDPKLPVCEPMGLVAFPVYPLDQGILVRKAGSLCRALTFSVDR